MGLSDVLGLLHAGPRQEEGEVLVDLSDREADRLLRLRVMRDQIGVVGNDDEASTEAHDGGCGLEILNESQWVVAGFFEVHDALLRNLLSRIDSHVERPVAKPRDATLRPSVGEQQIEHELTIVAFPASQRGDSLLSSSLRHTSSREQPSTPTGACLDLRHCTAPSRRPDVTTRTGRVTAKPAAHAQTAPALDSHHGTTLVKPTRHNQSSLRPLRLPTELT